MSASKPWYENEDCIQCEEPLTHTGYPEDSEYIGQPGSGAIYVRVDDGDLGHLCLYCRESWDLHSSTALAFQNGTQIATAHYGDGIAFDIGYHAEGEGFEGNGLADLLHGLARGEGYIKTDGWRGYTTQASEADGFEKVDGGSLLFGRETDSSKLAKQIKSGEVSVDYPIVIAVGTTSNVMAHTMNIYVPEDRVEHFQQACEQVDA